MKSISFVRETFTAGETAAITGVTTMQQRNMRRLGHDAKSTPGHARHDLYALGKLRTMKMLGEYGLPPGAVSTLSESAAVVIYVWAAHEPAATGDPPDLAKGERPAKSDPRFKRFLVWDGYEPAWVETVAEHYEAQEETGGIPTAVILDLRAIARDLVERSPRPFWRVIEVED